MASPQTDLHAAASPGGAPSYARALLAAAIVIALTAVAISVSALGPADGVAAAGVNVGAADVGGKGEADLRLALENLGRDLEAREIALVQGAKELRVAGRDLGFTLDIDATTKAVLAVGRERGLSGALRSLNRTRVDVDVVFSIDPTAFDELVPSWEQALIEDAPFDGALEVDATGVVARLPRPGHRIDRAALRVAIERELSHGGTGPIALPVVAVVPPIPASEIERAALQGRAILAAPVTLSFTPTAEEIELVQRENEQAERQRKDAADRAKQNLPRKKSRMKRKGKRLVEERDPEQKAESFPLPEPVEVVFEKADLHAAFRAHRVDDPQPHFVVELDQAEVKRKLAPTVGKLFNAARDARFEIDAQNRVTVVPSRPGTRVDTSRLVDALYEAARTPERRGLLPVDKDAEPKFTTEAAQALAIKGLVSEFTTHHACCQPRVKNIHRICDMLDGAIIKPEDTFSVNAAVGPRTLARGFVVAPSIGDGEMTETPGGGVSQFATTLYNALFDGGYVIRERKPHSFYFNRYPMGLEATLSYPQPDLVFFNDTKAAMLLRCDYSETHIRVRLFGDNGGRRIDRRVSQPFNYTDPRVEYLGNPRREPDNPKVRDQGTHGFSVVTTRVISLPDNTRREEKRTVKYTGKPRLIEVHPCEIPKGEKGHTGEKCPDPPKEEPGSGGASGG